MLLPILLLILLSTLVLLAGTGIIVFFAIRHAGKQNRQYEKFALENGYTFDKAMVRVGNYRDYSKNTQTFSIKIPNKSPYIDKYADYSSFPFGRGTEKQVSYVIEGNYKQVPFKAFTYQFTGNLMDGGGSGGVYAIVMIRTDINQDFLPEGVFYEDGCLCHYAKGNLNTEEIKPSLDKLINLTIGN